MTGFESMTSHYTTLSIATNASQELVKHAFRELSKRHHPDKPGGNVERYKSITAAYAVLGNAAKRREYDSRMGIVPGESPLAKMAREMQERANGSEYIWRNQASASYVNMAQKVNRVADLFNEKGKSNPA